MSIKQQIRETLNIKDLKINVSKKAERLGINITLNFTPYQFEAFRKWVMANEKYYTILRKICKDYLLEKYNEVCEDKYIFIDLNY